MARIKVLALLLLLACSMQVLGEFSPALPHEHGRTPAVAWEALKTTSRAEAVVRDIATTYGWSFRDTWNILEEGRYRTEQWTGKWYSTGFQRVGNDLYAVGSIYRHTYPGELFAIYEDDNGNKYRLLSGTCGNGDRKPDMPVWDCKVKSKTFSTNAWSSPDVSVGDIYIGADTAQGTGDGVEVECGYFNNEGGR